MKIFEIQCEQVKEIWGVRKRRVTIIATKVMSKRH